MNVEKTKQVSFSKAKAWRGEKQGTFDFLGFTFYLGKTRKGYFTPKMKTSVKRVRRKLKVVNKWCQENRHKAKLRILWKIFCSKLRGHIQYYGVSDNSRQVEKFVWQATRIFYKWINRRSQRKTIKWEDFTKFRRSFPPPKVIVRHRMY